VRRLPDRLVGSHTWIEYDGISNHRKLLHGNANFEEFEVDNPEKLSGPVSKLGAVTLPVVVRRLVF
jgi:hypothetical protein